MRNIWAKMSYFWFIFMLAIVGFLCGAFKVNASSITPDHSRLDLGTRTCGITGRNCYNSNTGWNTIPGTINTGISNGDLTSIYNFHFQTFGNSNVVFNTDNVYTLKYTFTLTYNSGSGMNYSSAFDYMKKNFKVDRVAGNTDASSSGQTDDVIRSYSYTLNKSSDGSAFILTITFTPSANLKFVSPYFRDKSWDPSHNGTDVITNGPYGFQFSKVVVNSVKMSYNTGTTGAINQQTEVIHQDNIEINQNITDINDNITSDDVDSPNDSLQDMQDMLPSNSTITSLIALPITLYQKVLNNVNGTCSSMNLGALYGTNLIMPCIEISDYLGNTLWNTIDLIISGIFVLTIARKMIKAFNNFTFMKEGDVIND